MPHAYYNEIDPYAVEWLRNLIAADLLPSGDVDPRSIKDVTANDLKGFTQCHFFAGIGGWSLAARLAGWPDDRELWTGSCPCQPFSVAGSGGGASDPRHLWPDFHRLIGAGRPPVVMGEQVAGLSGYGWFDGVRTDLEAESYACRAVDIPACAVDAPHERNRLYWIAVANRNNERSDGKQAFSEQAGRTVPALDDRGHAVNGNGQRLEELCGAVPVRSSLSCIERADDGDRECAMGNPNRIWKLQSEGDDAQQRGWSGYADAWKPTFWRAADWIGCHDGKSRRTKPGIRLLAHGVPSRVAKMRAFGNAIVPQEAAEVIKAWMEVAP